ncbi:MAG: iron-regulated protein, partial [Myxococcales bacterium]|nr:iron-regulated protein [Myxococcales bacterium]
LTDETATAPNGDRRAQYLAIVADLLPGHLAQVAAAWDPDGGSYRAAFLAAEPAEGLRRVLTGMIVLSGFETGGERLQTAFDSADQEDEHSCFSDNTHRDMVRDIDGILAVFRGVPDTAGHGVRDVIAARDAALAAAIDARIAESQRLANALQPPFDREIRFDNPEGRARIEALIVSLKTQESLLEDAFRLFGLDVPAVE